MQFGFGFIAVLSMQMGFVRPDVNAFLDRKAETVSQLISEIRTNPAVANRYMRFYGLTKNQVIALVSNYHIARLKSNELFEMYSIPPSGWIKGHLALLHKGERVYSASNGQPKFRALCGNPIVPAGQSAFDSPVGLTGRPSVFRATYVQPQFPVAKMIQVEPNQIALMPLTSNAPIESASVHIPIVTQMTPLLTSNPVSSNSLDALAPILLGGGVFFGTSSHGGGRFNNPPLPPQAVPAPSSIETFIFGFGIIAYLKRTPRSV